MKLISIGRLALIYLVFSGAVFLALAAYFWQEMAHTSEQLRAYETDAAKTELSEALAAIRLQTNEIGKKLAEWDETKQQLVFPEYYSLWRDNRVRDAGLLPNNIDSVALYDKSGRILTGANSADPMPIQLPGTPPLSIFVKEDGHDHFYVFMPIHADPAGAVLLGHIGLKFDLLESLAQVRAYRYADIPAMKVNLPTGMSIDADKVLQHLTIQARRNPEITEFESLLHNSVLRLIVAVFIVLALATLIVNRLLVKPLRGLSQQISTLNDPNSKISAQVPKALPLRVMELESVRRSLNDYQTRLAELHSNLEQNSRDFYDQAHHDALTGAFNRRAFDQDWHAIGEDRRLENVALVLFDCDHFKAINDTYGHNVGDAVIQAIALCLQSALRADDRLYRIGGDEFAALIRDTDRRHAESVAERCLEHILKHDFRPYGISEPITVSIGISIAQGEEAKDHVTLTELQKRADLAMYAAKRPGGQKIMFYTDEIGSVESLVANRAINAVFQAIHDPSLIEIAYQAIVRLPLMLHDYSEALTRIRFEDRLIYPGDIFPIVQNRNLDAEFDLAIIRAISRDMISGKLPMGAGVSINISAPGIVNARVVEAMVELLKSEKGRKIVVEITETALITQMDTATSNIRRLHEAGALVALDDFGSGYSSLRYLASMPVDLVKFDISMVHLLESGEPRQKLMIEEIARMALTAGYELVAEGIEDRALLDRVIRLGFSHAQGYYFGKPGEATVNVLAASMVSGING